MAETVRAWAEKVTIPTYPTGLPEVNPLFLEKRVYQGSSGAVYPHPVIERVFDQKEEREYTAVFLENRYLKIMVLPEIGGRVQMALDKTNGYHFIYYNRVIKPALVGLTGPWISGGIEFNWPQHHRPSTFQPLDWRIDEEPDGSKTVWCTEIERMSHTKGMHGLRLYPERAYLEVRVQLHNRTDQPQTFLWWANPAVHTHADHQSVFPPDVHAVMDHGKRAVSSFPIATGIYYKVNYAPGTDISRYRNIPVPTSYMAYHSDFDFIGDYDHSRQAGMLHVANHHIVPGKKQWTWGSGDFGRSWDRQLTDEDGPYIELMCGAYTDNQPDFSWIMPGEEKSFTQVFMPYKLIGPACNASPEAVLHLDVQEGQVGFGVYVTWPRPVTVRLFQGNTLLHQESAALAPETALLRSVQPVGRASPAEICLQVLDEAGGELLSFRPLPDEKPAIPAPARAAAPPAEIASGEELYLNGLHLEQYRHATYPPEPYYEEALRRDPGDSRCHNALGRLLYRRGKFTEAEAHFRRAIERLTQRNPNPYEGEPYYNLGLALKLQGREQEAWAAFYKAVWNAAWQEAGYLELARLAARAGRFAEALELTERALQRGWANHQARQLKIALLRRLGREEQARAEIELALRLDRCEYGALWEKFLLERDPAFSQLVRPDPFTYSALALDYAEAGLYAEAADLLSRALARDGGDGDHAGACEPATLAYYYLGWVYAQAGDEARAAQAFAEAAAQPPDYVFPNRLQSLLALECARRLVPADARASYYLGNFWYAHRRYAEAIACWETAARLEPAFPTVFRNLGLAYYNQLGEAGRAQQAYEMAHRLDPGDGRVFFELDQLCKRQNLPPAERLARLAARADLVEARDDLMIEYLNLLLILGRHTEALARLRARVFHPWEGGEGKVTGVYVDCLVEAARQQLQRGDAAAAIPLLEQARSYPPNLGEGKLFGALENNVLYYLGLAHDRLGQAERARACYQQAAAGSSEPSSPLYYNDQPAHMLFYQGLALQQLGRGEQARSLFEKLLQYGLEHLQDEVRLDYFAVSLPDFLVFDEDLRRRNQAHCHYMQALGYLGLGLKEQAEASFASVLALSADHTGAHLHRRLLD
jgi:tetratricopeptide (TPR) repeat protein